MARYLVRWPSFVLNNLDLLFPTAPAFWLTLCHMTVALTKRHKRSVHSICLHCACLIQCSINIRLNSPPITWDSEREREKKTFKVVFASWNFNRIQSVPYVLPLLSTADLRIIMENSIQFVWTQDFDFPGSLKAYEEIIICLIKNIKVHCHVQKGMSLTPISSQFNSIRKSPKHINIKMKLNVRIIAKITCGS